MPAHRAGETIPWPLIHCSAWSCMGTRVGAGHGSHPADTAEGVPQRHLGLVVESADLHQISPRPEPGLPCTRRCRPGYKARAPWPTVCPSFSSRSRDVGGLAQIELRADRAFRPSRARNEPASRAGRFASSGSATASTSRTAARSTRTGSMPCSCHSGKDKDE